MLNEFAYAQGAEDGMAKFAISRFRQYARDTSQQAWNSQQPADIAKARAATQQAYKPRVLGAGSEGTATLRMMPQAAAGGALTPTVRKEFDPNASLASPELINRRIAMGPALNETGDFAKYYGHGQTAAGRKYIDSEFVPGKIAPGADVSKAQSNIDRSVRSVGMKSGMGHLAAKDIRAENLGVNPQTGKTVALDYMPMKRQEAYDPRYARMSGLTDPTAVIPAGPAAKLFPNRAKEFADPGGFMEGRAKDRMKQTMQTNPQKVLPPPAGAPAGPAQAPGAPTVAGKPPPMQPTGVVPMQPTGVTPPQVAGPSVFGSL
jgi:hypothetical protein